MSASAARLSTPAYRPDIDGLRALAVIAVILFHVGVAGLGGGYAGVDVFFVISGYLITQLLEGGRAQGARRTLSAFYLRRIRRILPALLATCLLSALAGLALFVPSDLVYLGKYLAAAPLLMSNVASWTDGGYFRSGNEFLPLSHLWSIAVEEQFYLVYPLALLAVTRFVPRHRLAALTAVGVGSLALCIWASYHRPGANYFLAPTRAWELLLGATLALGGTPRPGGRLVNECLAAAALAGIALAMHLLGAHTPYPGAAALLPCAATAALIATGREPRPALVNRLLAWRPLVFVGLISYSLYLWHRPLLVFAAYFHITPLGPGSTVLLLAALTLLAVLSWRIIERPIRARTLLRTPRALLLGAALGSASVLLTGLALWYSDGWPQRFSPQVRMLLPQFATRPELLQCMRKPLADIESGLICDYGPRAGATPALLVWGDSHTLALMPAYEELIRSRGMHLYFAARSSCLPLLATAVPPATSRPPDACSNFNSAVIAAVGRLDPQVVILAAHWVERELPPGVVDIPRGIESTARALGGTRSTCVVLAVPTLKYPGTYALVMARRRHIDAGFLALSRAEAVAPYQDMERAVGALARRGIVRVADPKDILCPGERCRYEADGRSLYYDDNHLSDYGAHYVAAALEPCFAATR